MIEYYDLLYANKKMPRQPRIVKTPEELSAGKPILGDAKEITLAQFDPVSKDAITAHVLSDYRRKQFNLILLPKIDIYFDILLKGNHVYEKLLSDESPYS